MTWISPAQRAYRRMALRLRPGGGCGLGLADLRGAAAMTSSSGDRLRRRHACSGLSGWLNGCRRSEYLRRLRSRGCCIRTGAESGIGRCGLISHRLSRYRRRRFLRSDLRGGRGDRRL